MSGKIVIFGSVALTIGAVAYFSIRTKGAILNTTSDLGSTSIQEVDNTDQQPVSLDDNQDIHNYAPATGDEETPTAMTITNEPSTWPTGDKIWDIARAIATAEGYYNPTSNPYRLNNPGDISDYASTYGAETHSGSSVTNFPDALTGWNKLYEKLYNISTGQSHSYSPNWTWEKIAQTWAGDWKNWLNNVTRELGVSKDSTFGGYLS